MKMLQNKKVLAASCSKYKLLLVNNVFQFHVLHDTIRSRFNVLTFTMLSFLNLLFDRIIGVVVKMKGKLLEIIRKLLSIIYKNWSK